MIWRWLTFFSVVLWLGLPATSATVGGQVELTNSRNAAVRRRNDYSGVVLWLEALSGAGDRAGAEGRPSSLPARRVEMRQKDKSFVPHVLAIAVGGTVDFPNLDPIFHNAFSNFSGGTFDVGLYPPGTSRSVLFRKPGIVRVFCNIHPTMSAIIAVSPTPWYDVSRANGKYTIANVPTGDYQLRIFHERALAENLSFLEHRITVPESGLTLPLISISETGYIPVPHLNKFNQPYPPESPGGKYSGVN
jgi:plastocyanin